MRNLMGEDYEEEEVEETEAESVEPVEVGPKGDEKASAPVSLPVGSQTDRVVHQRATVQRPSEGPQIAHYAGLHPFTHIPLWSVDGELVSKSNIPLGYEVEPQSKRYVFRG